MIPDNCLSWSTGILYLNQFGWCKFSLLFQLTAIILYNASSSYHQAFIMQSQMLYSWYSQDRIYVENWPVLVRLLEGSTESYHSYGDRSVIKYILVHESEGFIVEDLSLNHQGCVCYSRGVMHFAHCSTIYWFAKLRALSLMEGERLERKVWQKLLIFLLFKTIFVSSHMYPNLEETQVIVGSMNMGYNIRHCQESNSQLLLSQTGANPPRPQWQTVVRLWYHISSACCQRIHSK